MPDSLERWKDISKFFWSMDFSNEKRFKSELKAYYGTIYRGKLLKDLTQWVDRENLESEYYSYYFSDLKDTKLIKLTSKGKNRYEADTVQNSCYSLEYNPPAMEIVVADYKVKNLTQEQVNRWLTSLKPTDIGEICLTISHHVRIQLNPSDHLVVSEQWNIVESTARLNP
ncbi:MAG: hypothetical protein OEV42_09435 [Deltaproteobacteria bacterium]|nr:hypothetical protein [Deltaproteobacteria bacterium]